MALTSLGQAAPPWFDQMRAQYKGTPDTWQRIKSAYGGGANLASLAAPPMTENWDRLQSAIKYGFPGGLDAYKAKFYSAPGSYKALKQGYQWGANTSGGQGLPALAGPDPSPENPGRPGLQPWRQRRHLAAPDPYSLVAPPPPGTPVTPSPTEVTPDVLYGDPPPITPPPVTTPPPVVPPAPPAAPPSSPPPVTTPPPAHPTVPSTPGITAPALPGLQSLARMGLPSNARKRHTGLSGSGR